MNKTKETKETKTKETKTTNPKPSKLPLIHSFARIKPSSADKKGGNKAKQTISLENSINGTVTFDDNQSFKHFSQTIVPTDTQSHCYNTICAPLTARWLDGYDVDLICYGQTGKYYKATQEQCSCNYR